MIYSKHEMWYMSSILWNAYHLVATNDALLYTDSVYVTNTWSLFLDFLGIEEWLDIDIGCLNPPLCIESSRAVWGTIVFSH